MRRGFNFSLAERVFECLDQCVENSVVSLRDFDIVHVHCTDEREITVFVLYDELRVMCGALSTETIMCRSFGLILNALGASFVPVPGFLFRKTCFRLSTLACPGSFPKAFATSCVISKLTVQIGSPVSSASFA